MRHEEFLRSVDDVAEYVWKYQKTENLIAELAKSEFAWNQSDIGRAIAETGSFDFSVDDVKLIRICKADTYMQGLESQIEKRLKEMTEKVQEFRAVFYENEVEPIVNLRNKRKNELKQQFGNLIFYGK